ncbi:MAG TPA: phosphodiester glycosidase family protein, partial [Thermoanaerobaculia bacterium]|nr:phosphodiester glycosidase family protein [Thermoanaerobaculia bacterium]
RGPGRRRPLVVLFCALLGCTRADVTPAAPEPKPVACVADWTAVASGIEYKTLNCTPSRFDLHLVRVDPNIAPIDAVVRPGSTATDLGREYTFALNANFFDENYRPLGVVVTSGKVSNPLHPVSWQSVFFIDDDNTPRIVPMEEFKKVGKSATAAAQCGPRLVVDGEKNKVARAEPAWRSGVCIDPRKRVIFFATPPETALDVHEMVDLAAGPMGCRDAMLFDGGPSTQMYLKRAGEPVVVEGDKRVPAYVVVK